MPLQVHSTSAADGDATVWIRAMPHLDAQGFVNKIIPWNQKREVLYFHRKWRCRALTEVQHNTEDFVEAKGGVLELLTSL